MAQTIETKVCKKCNQEKTLSFFSKNSKCKLGVTSECKECESARKKQYYQTNNNYIKQRCSNYRQNNRDIVKETHRKYAIKNIEKIRKYRASYRNREEAVKERATRKKALEERKQLNKELIFEKRKRYYAINRDKKLTSMKKYREKNLEKIKKYQKEYGKSLKGMATIKNKKHKRRDSTKQGDATAIQMMELQQRAKTCYWCGISLQKTKIHIDHYFPLSKGGQHTLNNLVVSCQLCNNRKHAKDPLVFANEIGRLL